MTIEQAIIKRFRDLYIQGIHGYINGGEVERKIADQLYCKASTVGRILRDMTEDNQGEWLEKEERPNIHAKGISIWYKYKPSKYDEINRLNNK